MQVKFFTPKAVFFMVVMVVMIFTSKMARSAQICADNFSWTQSSTVSPNDTACRTVCHTTDNANAWTSVYQNGSGEMRVFSPATTAHIPLQFGGCAGGPQFPSGPLNVLYVTMSYIEQTGHDGAIFRFSFDGGSTYASAAALGITVEDGCNTVMSSSTALEAPPVGLRGLIACSGNHSSKVKLTFPASTPVGNMIFQVYYVSDSSVSASGVFHVTGVEYWVSPLGQPWVACTGDNTSFKVSCGKANDPRETGLTIRDGATVIGTSCPLDITNQANGVTHNITVEGNDGNGNLSPPASCSVTPTCGTGAPPEALIQLKKLFGTDIQVNFTDQTMEGPCGTGVRPVGGGYNLFKASTPNGSWGAPIASSAQTSPTFNQQGALLNLNTEFLLEVNVDP